MFEQYWQKENICIEDERRSGDEKEDILLKQKASKKYFLLKQKAFIKNRNASIKYASQWGRGLKDRKLFIISFRVLHTPDSVDVD